MLGALTHEVEMPGIPFSELAEKFVLDLERAGATVLTLGDLGMRPLRIRVLLRDHRDTLDVYLWTVTGGGKGRGRPTERRIQLTRVESLPLRAGVRVLLGGWSEEEGVYAFWDTRRHQTFTAGSPSLQIDQRTLQDGYHYGFSAESREVREGSEVAVAVQPDYLPWYIQQWERLYECGPDVDKATKIIDAPVEEERHFVDSGESNREKSRRHKIVMAVQAFRDARFRPTVLRAYGYKCCLTNMALRLVDAAHIVPVTLPGSTDAVSNGLALATHLHRAYDNGLLGILPGGRIAFNRRAESQLDRDNLADGLAALKSQIPRRIRLPHNVTDSPDNDALMKGLEVRGWSEDEIEQAMKTA
ncbi:MAG: hypothetical protein GVY16_04060 [Planctomycetes bacterium]|nr:HNH endonuclease [Phycisphaerae bacterium]NBB94896.1 hypothetical protein [Planctomycetota bacterium]